MTNPQLMALACFTPTWRTAYHLRTIRGADLSHLPRLIKEGLVEEIKATVWHYRITDAGQQLLAKHPNVEPPPKPERNLTGGWKTCRRGHRYQGKKCPTCAGKPAPLRGWQRNRRDGRTPAE